MKFIHKPIYEETLKAITNSFNISIERSNLARSNRVPKMKIFTKYKFLIKSVLHKSVYIYSLLPGSIRLLNPKKFIKNILEDLRYYWEPNSIPKPS